MSTVEREPATLFVHDWSADNVVNGVVYGLFGIHLVLVFLAHTTGSVLAWQLAASAILLGAVLGCRLAAGTYEEIEQLQTAFLGVLGFTFVVLGVLYQSSSPGLGLGPNRPFAVTIVFVLSLSFLLVVTDARRYTLIQWGAVACFAVLTGVYLANSLAFVPSSTQSRWPLWAAIVMGSNLLVIPRLVPEEVFLWFLPRLAAVTVLLGLFTYVIGDYALWIFEVRQYSSGPTPQIPGFDPGVTTLQSAFPNPNSFGMVTFAGVVAAFVEFHRSVVARRPLGASVAAVLMGLCGLGLFLSNARAAMLAAAVAVGIYAVYAVGGRLTVPVTVVASVLGVAGLLAGMYVGVIDISATNRFELWSASLGAIRDGPLLFGYGNGSTAEVIDAYHTEDSFSPHNSYLRVFIQAGFVGGLAYAGLVVGTIVAGMVDYREVDVAMLAFAVGWATHQMFESYTMFQWGIGSVLAALVVGYLLLRE
ncbi:O-antigen ligase family protein [Saliphagus infecundisoli]|uniref:O-antigen ligase family protein n=1 Tax=Saliphagus infecundisoli TaxID=1849069 RepID=A0ABD5QKT6_9EURY|nr:O-antigen ligase family protein [Saliphagus infecundisoli]